MSYERVSLQAEYPARMQDEQGHRLYVSSEKEKNAASLVILEVSTTCSGLKRKSTFIGKL